MQISIDQIIPDPEQKERNLEGQSPGELRKGLSSIGLNQPVLVRPVDGNGNGTGLYMIVVGERRWRTAQSTGQVGIDCTVREDVSEQDIRELQLSESYHHESVPPMDMGRAFLSYRERFGVSQQELARRTGITPGTIHHYESLVRNLTPDLGEKVQSGELTFKEGRSIADIDGADRQREIAEPFVSGRLSSVYVEKVVGHAKKNPTMPIEQILEDVLKGTRAEDKVQKEVEPAPKTGIDITKLEATALQLAGELDAMQLQVIPEYRRLNIISALRILDSKVQSSVQFLSGGIARESGMPRPLIRTVE